MTGSGIQPKKQGLLRLDLLDQGLYEATAYGAGSSEATAYVAGSSEAIVYSQRNKLVLVDFLFESLVY